MPHGGFKPTKAAAPFDNNHEKALSQCFDRETGEPVGVGQLKTYREALAQFHLHPEAKFHNGSFLNSGVTTRRHIRVGETHYIGKEANRLEQRQYLGDDGYSQQVYKTSN